MVNYKLIAKLLEEKNIQQKDLAAKVGVSPAMMTYIVNGLKTPSVKVLVVIAKELDVTVDSLLIKEG